MIEPASIQEAIALQQRLRERLTVTDDFEEIRFIAGVDVGYNRAANESRASCVLMRRGELQPLEQHVAVMETTFPYVPGLLSFREIPVVMKALQKLSMVPDLLMVDGQGIAHPRRMGIAAHLGLLMDVPSIGVAKKRLCGTYQEPAPSRGAFTPLMHQGEHIGTVLRSKERCNPLFLSPGHRVGHEMALKLTLECLTNYRLPEPTRLADNLSKVPKEGEVGELFGV